MSYILIGMLIRKGVLQFMSNTNFKGGARRGKFRQVIGITFYLVFSSFIT